MISLSEVGGLYRSIPTNIKDARTKAFADACDRQIKKLLERAERIKVWCAIENVDEKYLDFLATDCRALFYNSGLAPDIKRSLIMNSQYWYMKLGTSAAMEEMINIVFQNNDTSIEEWHTYAGDAFHFRIATSSAVTTVEIAEFLKYINDVKNVRSILDYLVLQSNGFLYLENDSGVFRTEYLPCNDDTYCGTNPDYAVELHTIESTLDLSATGDRFVTEYDAAGMNPDYAVGLHTAESMIDAESQSDAARFDYGIDGDRESGTSPDYAMGLVSDDAVLDIKNATGAACFDYNADNEVESGRFPSEAVGLQLADESLDFSESRDDFAFDYRFDHRFASEDV